MTVVPASVNFATQFAIYLYVLKVVTDKKLPMKTIGTKVQDSFGGGLEVHDVVQRATIAHYSSLVHTRPCFANT